MRTDRAGDSRQPGRVSQEAGAMTLWLLGLAVIVLAVGGISVDLWRVTTQRRAIAAAVDAAAAAGAGMLDVAHLRTTDQLQLAPEEAQRAAEVAMAGLSPPGVSAYAAVATPASVMVVAEGEVDLTLLRILIPGALPVRVRVEAVAAPRASP